jgi:ABC-type Zn2+ transport system substrate-binding protein/surface adhesin
MAEELAKEKEKMAGELAKKMAGELAKKMAEELAEEKQKIAEEFAQKKEKLRNWEAELLAREKSLTEKGTIGADDGKK